MGRNSLSGGALAVLAAGFAASAVLRAGEVVAGLPAIAQDLAEAERVEAASPIALPEAPEAEALIAELLEREERLIERENALEDRAQTLEAIEARIRSQLLTLEQAQERLEETAVIVDDAAGRDVRHLAKMYAAMKSDQAAAIFNRMTPSFAAGFLAKMDAEAAALILSDMDAEKAYAVSLILASRNVDAPRSLTYSPE